jgi:IPT/TIG domain
MRINPCVATLVISAALGMAPPAAAQPVAPLTIQSVTLQPNDGVITITGTGFGADVVVTIDGPRVTVLPGATATRVEVQPPATVLTTPGTYRLSVVDPARRVGDVFVVGSSRGSKREPGGHRRTAGRGIAESR